MGKHGRPPRADYDLNFHFDPVCPFAWMTSKWVRQVCAAKDYRVEWKFISLRLINAEKDYDTEFPPEYLAAHTAGLRLLRVAAAVRAKEGPEPIAALYYEFGTQIHDTEHAGGLEGLAVVAEREYVLGMLDAVGLSRDYADALEDEAWDADVQADTDRALELTGKDVGTPILQVDPPDGVAFFGPVISRHPSDEEAVELWDAVLTLTRFPSFAELKRSLRERPQLVSMGVKPGDLGQTEDWHGGSRKPKK
jgi:hypothetical protein